MRLYRNADKCPKRDYESVSDSIQMFSSDHAVDLRIWGSDIIDPTADFNQRTVSKDAFGMMRGLHAKAGLP